MPKTVLRSDRGDCGQSWSNWTRSSGPKPSQLLDCKELNEIPYCDYCAMIIAVQSTNSLSSSRSCETPPSSCLGSVMLSASVCPHLPYTPRLPQNYHDLLYIVLYPCSSTAIYLPLSCCPQAVTPVPPAMITVEPPHKVDGGWGYQQMPA
jgi:hypothetical protein